MSVMPAISPCLLPSVLATARNSPAIMGGLPARDQLAALFVQRDGVWVDTIGLSIISGTWPNCTVQAIPGGLLDNFGPFAGGAIVNFSNLPKVLANQFYWGARGYAFYSPAQSIFGSKRILSYLNSDSYVDYLYAGSEQIFVGGEPVAAIFGATL